MAPSLVWFRPGDLRLADNPALHAAAARGGPVVPVFVWAPAEDGRWAPGGASRWWLRRSLAALAADLERLESRLIVRQGAAAETLAAVAAGCGANAIFWNRRYEPSAAAVERNVPGQACPGNVLFEPGSILNSSGKPFQVFTAFWKACLAAPPPARPLPAPSRLAAPDRWPDSLPPAALDLDPTVDWAAGLRESWTPGESGAQRLWTQFRNSHLSDYAAERDRPDHPGTSRLSPHLHFGEISARQIWHGAPPGEFLRQVGWREFSCHLLHHFPATAEQPLRPEFARFPWRLDGPALRAWTRGRTGYPLVDAGMRELWRTGWMHNRVRMLAASFLVKDLLLPWQEGAAWFWDTLVDADLANNTMGWQWTAGCGADAAPYFRIFNPVTQGMKFDPDGRYVRRWIPELAALEGSAVHAPWESGMRPAGYPPPVVDLAASRAQALAAYARLRGR